MRAEVLAEIVCVVGDAVKISTKVAVTKTRLVWRSTEHSGQLVSLPLSRA